MAPRPRGHGNRARRQVAGAVAGAETGRVHLLQLLTALAAAFAALITLAVHFGAHEAIAHTRNRPEGPEFAAIILHISMRGLIDSISQGGEREMRLAQQRMFS